MSRLSAVELDYRGFQRGSRVHYHPVTGEGRYDKVWVIKDLGFMPGDPPQPVVWLHGLKRPVAIETLSKVGY